MSLDFFKFLINLISLFSLRHYCCLQIRWMRWCSHRSLWTKLPQSGPTPPVVFWTHLWILMWVAYTCIYMYHLETYTCNYSSDNFSFKMIIYTVNISVHIQLWLLYPIAVDIWKAGSGSTSTKCSWKIPQEIP